MPKRLKTRESVEEILASCSESLFPEELGAAPVSLSSCSVDGDTPLHVMVWRNNTYGILALVEAGADVNAVGNMSETPLHIAVRKGNQRAVEALLNAGADPALRSEFGHTPHDHANELGGGMARLFQNL